MPNKLTLTAFKDSELMHRIADHDGWVSSAELAVAIKLTGDRKNNNVGVRCGWLRRYGLVEKKVIDGVTHWQLTSVGATLIDSNRDAAKRLGKMSEGERMAFLDAIAKRLPKGKREVAHYGRRTFRHYMDGYRDSRL